jgi:hypothetical protein
MIPELEASPEVKEQLRRNPHLWVRNALAIKQKVFN